MDIVDIHNTVPIGVSQGARAPTVDGGLVNTYQLHCLARATSDMAVVGAQYKVAFAALGGLST
ncbi:MAG: hypothetical protein VX527_10440 [Planctomycetota bacterium]|nr:hypothetical protein [Planctomycetota bacterium]